jgi:hypothetical protein
MKALGEYFSKHSNIINIIIGIISILIGFANAVPLYMKPTKELKITVAPPVSLVNLGPEVTQDIQVLYQGKPVNKVFLLKILIQNTGDQPIAKADYDRPLLFNVSSKAELVEATVISSNPPYVGMTISKISEQQALVSTTPLYPNESISARFILTGESKEALSCEARILGIKEIKCKSPVELPNWVSLAVSTIIGIIAGAMAVIFFRLFYKNSYFRTSTNRQRNIETDDY